MNVTPREYLNLTDFLADHAVQLLADYRRPPAECLEWDYTDVTPEIDCVGDVMKALARAIDLAGLADQDVHEAFSKRLEAIAQAYRLRTAEPVATGKR
jgi:hypothetical protein